MTDIPQGPASRRVDRAGVAIALALAALAVVLVRDLRRLQTTTMYGMGAEVMRVVIASGSARSAIGNQSRAARKACRRARSRTPKPVWLILGSALAPPIAIIIGLGGGFILATSALV